MRWWKTLTAGLLLTALPCPAATPRAARPVAEVRACSFQPTTLRQELQGAVGVFYGTLTRATRNNPDTGTGNGITDFVIEKALVTPPFLKGETTITLDRYAPTAGNTNFVIFFDLVNGKIDPYRGIPVKKNSNLPTYLAGILKVKDEKPAKRLRFYFDYLNHPEPEIAYDALQEFSRSEYKDDREMAARLPGDRLAVWLRDPKTPRHCIGLFAFLLGHCSQNKEQDARLLRICLNEDLRTGIDHVLLGLVLLQPKQGWQEVLNLLRDPSADFLRRYAALRAVRFLKEQRPDLVSAEELVKGVTVLVDQPDITDLAIEDLRKWKCWDLTDRILALQSRQGFEDGHIRRAMLRFALRSPTRAAKRFVEEQRKSDLQLVEDMEELLKIEEGR
jgi:hypothetical protein